MQTPNTPIDTDNNQPSLVQVVTDILAKHGHTRPTDWVNGLHPDAKNTSDVSIQRFLINRYWRQQLGSLDIDTKDERYCLGDVGDVTGWIKTFDSMVAKCIVKYNLPPAVN